MVNKVATIVYKYNPNGFMLFGIYILCLAIAIWHSFGMSTVEVLIYGSIFLAVPLYVQYGNNEKVRMLVPDERLLVFSDDGLAFGDANYPIDKLETAAIFLVAFTGFTYRLVGEAGGTIKLNGTNVSKGDENKISIRLDGEVIDFTFCLTSYTQFCELRSIINQWVASGVNVVLRQAFNDEFMSTEIAYFGSRQH